MQLPSRRSPWLLSTKRASAMAMVLSLLMGTHTFGHIKIFDGRSKIIIWTHDSVEGGRMLGKRLGKYFNNNSPIKLVEVFARGAGLTYVNGVPIPTSKGSTCNYRDCWLDLIKNDIARIKNENPGKEVVLIVQCGIGVTYVADTTDAASVQKCLNEMKVIGSTLKKYGVDEVFLSTLHLNFQHRRFAENEPFVVREFKKLGTDYHAIDVVTETMQNWPYTSCSDKQHPTSYGLELFSHIWFRELLKHDDLDVPQWSSDWVTAEHDKLAAQRAEMGYGGPLNGRFKLGDEVAVNWKVDCAKFGANIRVRLQFRRMDRTYGNVHFDDDVLGDVATVPCSQGKFVFKVTEGFFLNRAGIKQLSQPTPFQITIAAKGLAPGYGGGNPVYSCQWKGSNDNYMRPESMVIFYPTTTIDPNAPIYPKPVNTSAAPINSVSAGAGHEEISVQSGPNGRATVLGAPSASAIRILDSKGRVVRAITADRNGMAGVNNLRSGTHIFVAGAGGPGLTRVTTIVP